MQKAQQYITHVKRYYTSMHHKLAFVSFFILFFVSSLAAAASAQELATTSTDASTTTTPIATSTPLSDTESVGTSTPVEESVETSVAPTVTTETLTTDAEPALSEAAQTRITNLAANVSNRLEATITRLTQISVRLDSRLTKTAADGVDVTIARGHYTDATESLAAARVILADIDTLVAGVTGSASPRIAWLSVKATYQAARTEVVSAYTSLNASVAALENPQPVAVPDTDEPIEISN